MIAAAERPDDAPTSEPSCEVPQAIRVLARVLAAKTLRELGIVAAAENDNDAPPELSPWYGPNHGTTESGREDPG